MALFATAFCNDLFANWSCFFVSNVIITSFFVYIFCVFAYLS